MKKLILFLLLNLAIYGVLVYGFKPSWQIWGDGRGYYSYLRSALFDGNFRFDNELKAFFDYQVNDLGQKKEEVIIHYPNLYSVGPAMMWTPFILTAKSFCGNSTNNVYHLSGFSPCYYVTLSLATAFYFFLGLAFLYLSLLRLFSWKTAFFIATFSWLLTPLVFYLVFDPSMSHVLSFSVVCALLFFSLKLKEKMGWGYLLGASLSFGLAVAVRWQNAVIAILPLVFIFLSSLSLRKKILFSLTLFFITFLVFIPQMLIWKMYYHHFLFIPQGSGFFNLFNPLIQDFLFSSYHGLIAWHPAILIAMLGLLLLFKDKKSLLIATLGILFIEIYVNSSVADWYGGAAFGMRRMADYGALFAIGWGAIFYSLRNRPYGRYVFMAVIIFFAFLNLSLLGMFNRRELPTAYDPGRNPNLMFFDYFNHKALDAIGRLKINF